VVVIPFSDEKGKPAPDKGSAMLLGINLTDGFSPAETDVDAVLYYTKLYAMAHGFWHDDGTQGGKVDAMGLYGYILWGGRGNPRSNPDDSGRHWSETHRNQKTPYEAAVISVFWVTGFDEAGSFWGH